MSVFKCKMCGGALEISEGMKICECYEGDCGEVIYSKLKIMELLQMMQ